MSYDMTYLNILTDINASQASIFFLSKIIMISQLKILIVRYSKTDFFL